MAKNYIRNYDSIEEMMSAYLSFSGESELVSFDANVYHETEGEPTLVGNKHFSKQNFNYYVTKEAMSGETPIYIVNSVSPSEFDDGKVEVIYNSSNEYTWIKGEIEFLIKGEVVDAVINSYDEVVMNEKTVLMPVFTINGSDYHFDTSTGLHTNGKKVFSAELINAFGLIIVGFFDDLNNKYTINDISNEEREIDESSYYYDPWVSVVPDVTEEVVTGLIDSSGNTYSYDRLLPNEYENHGIIHRWIKDSDGSYWYSNFRVPYKGKSLRNTIRDEEE